jgi:hypothetical protein
LIGGRNGGPTLVPLSESRFRVGNNELMFAGGENAGFEMRDLVGGRPVTFHRRQPAEISAESLAAYAGEYFSEDVNAQYVVTASDSGLSLRTGTTDPIAARPVFTGTFLGGGYTIQFLRNGAEVTGFEVTNSRMRRVKFVRVPPRR